MALLIFTLISSIYLLQQQDIVLGSSSLEYLVRRTSTYDEIQYSGNCNTLDGMQTRRNDIKWCTCIKHLNVKGVRTSLYGSLLIFEKSKDHNATIKCIYNYRETGANVFLSPAYSTDFPVITDKDKDVKRYITTGANVFVATQYDAATKMSLRSVEVYSNMNKTYVPHSGYAVFATQQIKIPKSKKVNWGLVLTTSSFNEMSGQLAYILLTGSLGKTKINGFTVVKFPGERKYRITIPKHSTPKLPPKKQAPARGDGNPPNADNETTYETIMYVLIGIIGALLIVLLFMMWRSLNSKKFNAKKPKEVFAQVNHVIEKEKFDPPLYNSDGSKRYQHLAPAQLKENYTSLENETQMNDRPKIPVPTDEKIYENAKSKVNNDGYEVNYSLNARDNTLDGTDNNTYIYPSTLW